MQPFEYVRAKNRKEALSAIAGTDPFEVTLWSGGTALIHLMKQGMLMPTRLVDIGKADDLGGIAFTEDGLTLGAGVRLSDLEHDATVRARVPVLARTAAQIGNVRVRHAARVGGYVAHADPAGDLAPVLLALDASVGLEKAGGGRKVALSDFYVDVMETSLEAGEMVSSVSLPASALARKSLYIKYAPRSLDDYATVGMAASVRLDGGTCREVRLAATGVGPTPMRFPQAEEQLVGRELNEAACREAAKQVQAACAPWDDDRGSADYKRAMARIWTERILTQLSKE